MTINKDIIKLPSFKIAVTFLVMGLIIVGLSLIGMFKPKSDKGTVEGVITNIKEEYTSVDDINYIVFVEYEVDGVTYNNEYGAYSSKMRRGDKVTVIYDLNDPNNIQAPGSESVIIIALISGIASMVFGIIALIKAINYKEDPLEKELLEELN